MKQVLSISFIIIFAFCGSAYYFAFTLSRQDIHEKIAQLFEKGENVELTFSSDQINNEVSFLDKDQKEFRYNGKLYDVVEMIVQGNQVKIRCIADDNETELVAHFQKQVEEQTNGGATSPSGKITFKSPVTDWLFEHTNISSTFFSAVNLQTAFQFPSSNSIEEIIAPPPRA